MSWAEIKKAINSNISKSLDVLITEKCNELQSKLNSVYNTVTVTGNIPSVKGVQRGLSLGGNMTTYDDLSNRKVFYIDITINAVNTSKSIVNVSGFVNVNNNDYVYMLLNSTTIRVYFDTAGPSFSGSRVVAPFTWEIIEFY